MKLLQKILILSIGLFLTGCEDVITADLDTAAPKLVIDASIDWVKNTAGNEQKIVLSTSTGYYTTEFPTVSGAIVTVTNSSSTVFNFIENPGTGEYICNNFIPQIGETYSMNIVLNGEIYTATETLIATSEIEDNIEQNNNGGETGDQIELRFFYQDNVTQENYYLNSVTQPHLPFPELEVEDDENTNGNIMSDTYSSDKLKVGDQINLRLYGISRRYYNYMYRLILASGNDGNPFSTIPSEVRGNIINQTNNKNYAFGYFRLSEVDTKTYTVQ